MIGPVIILGLINHYMYGMAADRMFSTELQKTVDQAHERLENNSIMMAQKTTKKRYRGTPATAQPRRLQGSLQFHHRAARSPPEQTRSQ